MRNASGRLNVKSEGARSMKETRNWLSPFMDVASMSTWRDACSIRRRAVKTPVPTANWEKNFARIYRYILIGKVTSWKLTFKLPLFLYHTESDRKTHNMTR